MNINLKGNNSMSKMMWAGRFSKEVDSKVNDFNSSISFDARMYKHDIKGSIAHATMLGECGIIDPADSKVIIEGLNGILSDIENGTLHFDPNAEDIHMFVEAELTARIGDAGKRLHTARSRNDQVALDIKLYLKDEVDEIAKLVRELINTVIDIAKQHTETVMPGYTHLQRAQPVTFAHHLMAYAQMLTRDLTRLADCKERMDVMPLGSCALAGTTYPLNRKRTAELLGFRDITMNSLDGVSDRDFCVELCSDISMLMMHLSRFSEEIIMWCSWEFKFIELDDAYSTGSSIMPQKKNPDVTELIRGKTARVYGDLQTLLTMMKGLPLAYNKDMQEDKEAVFGAIDTVKQCLEVFTPMFATMTLAASRGFINATDCADYLTKKGVPFRDAYKTVGRLVNQCIKADETLETMTMRDFAAISNKFGDDVYDALDLRTCVAERKVIGGPAPQEVTRQIDKIEKFVADVEDEL